MTDRYCLITYSTLHLRPNELSPCFKSLDTHPLYRFPIRHTSRLPRLGCAFRETPKHFQDGHKCYNSSDQRKTWSVKSHVTINSILYLLHEHSIWSYVPSTRPPIMAASAWRLWTSSILEYMPARQNNGPQMGKWNVMMVVSPSTPEDYQHRMTQQRGG